MSTSNDIWKKLENSKEYREEFALSLLKRSVAFQIKTLRKKRSGSQAVLAERAKLTQGVVSRAEDQNYGNLTFNTVGRIAGGLDMAFIGRFVPFSDLVRFSSELSESEFANIPTFDEEVERRSSEPVTATIDWLSGIARLSPGLSENSLAVDDFEHDSGLIVEPSPEKLQSQNRGLVVTNIEDFKAAMAGASQRPGGGQESRVSAGTGQMGTYGVPIEYERSMAGGAA